MGYGNFIIKLVLKKFLHDIILASFDKTQYKPGTEDSEVQSLLGNSVEPLKAFIQERMELETLNGVVRKDYFELLELGFLFLGGKIERKTKSKERVLFHPRSLDVESHLFIKNIFIPVPI